MAFRTQTFSFSYSGSMLSYGVGDFNQDGVLDLAFGGPATPFRDEVRPFKIISIYADGTIADTTTSVMASVPNAVHAREMFVGDLNGDGVDDIFSANTGYDAEPWPGERNTLMLSSGGRLVDASGSLPQAANFAHSVTGGDIDSDGDIDLFVGNMFWRDGVGSYFLLNDGRGNFTQDIARVPDTITGTKAHGLFTSTLLVDINGDSKLDLVVGSEQRGAGAGITYLNDGAGSFGSETVLPVGLFGGGTPDNGNGTITTDILNFDIDGDGDQDLLLAQTDGNPFYQGSKVQVLVNDGTGHFSDQSWRVEQPGNATWINKLELIDFNADGRLDLLGETDANPNVLWLNQGGSFTLAPQSAFATFEAGVIPLDFNKDGRMDFVSLDQGGDYWTANGIWSFKTHLSTHFSVTASSSNDSLSGSAGYDVIDAYEGNDRVYGYNGHDWIAGGEGFDFLDGGYHNDTIYGGNGNDTLMGGSSGTDRLFGDAGNDRLNGGTSNDILYGGSGKDIFIFDTKPHKASNYDTIKDFRVVDDAIYLDNKYFTRVGKGMPTKPVKLSSKAFWTGSSAHDADDRIIYNKKTGGLYYAPDGTGSASMVKFAVLSKGLALKYNDFYVI